MYFNVYGFPAEGIWYLVDSNEKKESAHGFWKARGEACMVYSDDKISGWRTTLEYFEGTAPNGQITDWLMQEYGITKNKFSAKDMPKVLETMILAIFMLSLMYYIFIIPNCQ